MKQINNYILEKLIINKDIKSNLYNYHPKSKDELKELVDKLIKERGNKADLNDIDTSQITDMSCIFKDSMFNGDISKWDVSNVKNMSMMFYNSNFNGDISNWDVSNVRIMGNMFENSNFNNDISNWKPNKNLDMFEMFENTILQYQNKLPKWYHE